MAALRQGDTTAGHGDAAVPLRSLGAVAAVASAGSVSRAAQALHQSSAAVTRAVQGAEQALGVMLFERGARGMVPTAAGEALALRVSRAFEALQAGANGPRARGAPPAVASLPRLVSDALLQALVARGTHPSEAAAAAAARACCEDDAVRALAPGRTAERIGRVAVAACEGRARRDSHRL